MVQKQKAMAKSFINGIVEEFNHLGFDYNTLLQLEEKILLSQSILDKITFEQSKEVDQNKHRVLIYGNTDFRKLYSDVEWLISYLKEGYILSGYFFSVYKIFANRKLRKRLYILHEVYIDAKPCNTLHKLEVVKNLLEIEITLSRVTEIWELQNKCFYSYLEKYSFFSELLLEAISVVQDCNLASLVLENIKFDLERNIQN